MTGRSSADAPAGICLRTLPPTRHVPYGPTLLDTLACVVGRAGAGISEPDESGDEPQADADKAQATTNRPTLPHKRVLASADPGVTLENPLDPSRAESAAHLAGAEPAVPLLEATALTIYGAALINRGDGVTPTTLAGTT